jgi:hypothetical protein
MTPRSGKTVSQASCYLIAHYFLRPPSTTRTDLPGVAPLVLPLRKFRQQQVPEPQGLALHYVQILGRPRLVPPWQERDPIERRRTLPAPRAA